MLGRAWGSGGKQGGRMPQEQSLDPQAVSPAGGVEPGQITQRLECQTSSFAA